MSQIILVTVFCFLTSIEEIHFSFCIKSLFPLTSFRRNKVSSSEIKSISVKLVIQYKLLTLLWSEIAQMIRRLLPIWRARVRIRSFPFMLQHTLPTNNE